MCNRLLYKPVFTAHPTESRRRTIMHHQREVFTIIDQLTDPRLSQFDRDDLVDQLQLQIETLWLTNEVRASKPTVIDEIKMGLHYFQRSLFEAVKVDYRYLERAVLNTYGEDDDGNPVISIPSFIEFGSWIGGDRDGNPFVTAELTRTALRMQAEEILSEHIRLVYGLTQVLTMSTRWFTPSDVFRRVCSETKHSASRPSISGATSSKTKSTDASCTTCITDCAKIWPSCVTTSCDQQTPDSRSRLRECGRLPRRSQFDS